MQRCTQRCREPDIGAHMQGGDWGSRAWAKARGRLPSVAAAAGACCHCSGEVGCACLLTFPKSNAHSLTPTVPSAPLFHSQTHGTTG